MSRCIFQRILEKTDVHVYVLVKSTSPYTSTVVLLRFCRAIQVYDIHSPHNCTEMSRHLFCVIVVYLPSDCCIALIKRRRETRTLASFSHEAGCSSRVCSKRLEIALL
jgi:hypothetical protein